ncbi:MAG TPA: thioredoxin domain-containing protein, partial [Pyrinomonadaceae bacterium]|nr:thioredoxin domain-containing protein [Pyrinomonadaceae bacterium]
NLDGSFPASDPPSWNLGTDHASDGKMTVVSPPLPDREPYLLSRPVGDADHIQGIETAPVTLLMYGAYECPHCVEGNKIVKQLQQRLGETLRFVFRHFPRINVHPHAEAAAEVAEAAGQQNKFWEMHDRLFENYNRLDGEHLVGYAEEMGLDMRQFDRAITGRLFIERVQEDLQSGLASGVRGTPSYFINGVRHNGSGELGVLLEAIKNKANGLIF